MTVSDFDQKAVFYGCKGIILANDQFFLDLYDILREKHGLENTAGYDVGIISVFGPYRGVSLEEVLAPEYAHAEIMHFLFCRGYVVLFIAPDFGEVAGNVGR